MQPARNTEQALLDALEPRRIAVVVGIDRYSDPMIPPLSASTRDAEDIARVLKGEDQAGFDRVEVLRVAARTARTTTTRPCPSRKPHPRAQEGP